MKYSVLILVLFCVSCGQIGMNSAEKMAAATRQAENYPWAFYPIDEESKADLCRALELAHDDSFCQEETEIWFGDVFSMIKKQFPVNKTTYDEVEIKLENFPYSIERILQPDDTLIDVGYVYQLTNYEGACITFLIDNEDNKIVTKILASSIGSGPIPTTCGPSE